MTSRSDAWRSAVDTVAPTVLVLGGFLTSPPLYVRFRAHLHACGAAAVVVAPIWLPDWLLAAPRGMGPIVTRAGRALLEAGDVAAEVSAGAPVMIVGHSAGGIVGRVLTSPEPFEGRRLDASERIGAIVTLGSPHRLASGPRDGLAGQELGRRAVDFAARVVPGAAFAPRVGYVSVTSRAVAGHPRAGFHERMAWWSYRSLLGGDVDHPAPGDGVVPVDAALLPGSHQIVLDSAVHTVLGQHHWYGSPDATDVWWPVAVGAWRDALRARAGVAPPAAD